MFYNKKEKNRYFSELAKETGYHTNDEIFELVYENSSFKMLVQREDDLLTFFCSSSEETPDCFFEVVLTQDLKQDKDLLLNAINKAKKFYNI